MSKHNLLSSIKEFGLKGYLRGLFYRVTMRVAHKYNWHYAPPSYPEGDTQLWFRWCGFRQTLKKNHVMGMKIETNPLVPKDQIWLVNDNQLTGEFSINKVDRCLVIDGLAKAAKGEYKFKEPAHYIHGGW